MNQRLLELYMNDLLPRDHVVYLDQMNIEPKVIYDIGSCVLHWTRHAQAQWPNAKIYLFEAMDEVDFLYDALGFEYELGAFSDEEKDLKFFQNTYHPGGNSYYQENSEINPDAAVLFSDDYALVKRAKTIKGVVESRGFLKPDLVKIDVQGAELDVLKGFGDILNTTEHLLVEMQRIPYNKGAPLVNETTQWIFDQGFELVAKFSNSRNDAPDADYHFRKKK